MFELLMEAPETGLGSVLWQVGESKGKLPLLAENEKSEEMHSNESQHCVNSQVKY